MRLIDADKLLDQLKDWRGDEEDVDKHDPHDIGYYAAMSRAIRFTCLSHTIDAAPVRHSCWKQDNSFIMCKACGTYQTKYDHLGNLNDFDFCPACGAKMDGELE